MANSRMGFHVGLTSLTLILIWRLIRRPRVRYPPSPMSLPFFGNIFSIPSGHEYIAFLKLGEQLKSDIIHLEILGHKIIILNSAEAASDVLEKRSAFHSDRPPLPMVKDSTLMNWSGLPSIVGYNDLWRQYRRMMNNWLNARAVTQFDGLQERQARLLLQRLSTVTNNTQPFEHVRKEFFFTMASSIFQLAYGYILKDTQDQFFVDSQRAFHNATVAGMQTNFLVNIFPMLSYIPDWFPGTGWKRTAREWGAHQVVAKTAPYEWMKARVASGTYQASVLSSLIQDHRLLSGLSPSERDERLKEIGIVLYGGGTDTAISFVAAMVLNPHVQAKAQQELDAVVGQDKERLPYIRNLIDEVLRLYPVVPLGVPHACFQDDVYRGYDIQKGTTILGNVWAIGRDPRYYEDPEMFNPDRYIDPGVPRAPVFGWGRRKCPGIHFAETSIFITAALLLSVFTFSKRRDNSGEEIIPIIEPETNALVLELKPFDFEFKSRSDAHYQLILSAISD
ncbi:Premnaspirodiene oxygenase [Rhizoctonia solani]|uniref:Premnaspirodiene oxygenase n=2 Tax=Rhizoctonia solani TaxID=456999 RepID=A0A0K6FZ51_9AGAM|nr:Premnaspirodiene oxygenase [Rhizoctonia solani]